MPENLIEANALLGLVAQEALDEVLGLGRDGARGDRELGGGHSADRLPHAVGAEGLAAEQQVVEEAAQRPQVGLEAVRVAARHLGDR